MRNTKLSDDRSVVESLRNKVVWFEKNKRPDVLGLCCLSATAGAGARRARAVHDTS